MKTTLTFLALLLLFGSPAPAADPPGKLEVRATVVLLDDGVKILDDWSSTDVTDHAATQRALREACGRVAVSRELLRKGAASTDAEVAAAARKVKDAADLLGRMVDMVMVPDFSSGSWEEDLMAYADGYDHLREDFPRWSSTSLGADQLRRQYQPEVDTAIRDVDARGACKSRASDEAYQKKREAWAARNAAMDKRRAEGATRELVQRDGAAPAGAAKAPGDSRPADFTAVAAWHRDVYSLKLFQLKRHLGRTGMVDRNRRTQALLGICGDIYSTTDELLRDRKLASGAPAIDQALKAMLETFKTSAEACAAGNLKLFNATYQQGEQKRATLGAALAPYQLKP